MTYIGQDWDDDTEYVTRDRDAALAHTSELLWLDHCLKSGLTPGVGSLSALEWALDVIQEHLDIDVMSLDMFGKGLQGD